MDAPFLKLSGEKLRVEREGLKAGASLQPVHRHQLPESAGTASLSSPATEPCKNGVCIQTTSYKATSQAPSGCLRGFQALSSEASPSCRMPNTASQLARLTVASRTAPLSSPKPSQTQTKYINLLHTQTPPCSFHTLIFQISKSKLTRDSGGATAPMGTTCFGLEIQFIRLLHD